ncbi:MAG: hypothetical protein ACOH18_05585 [Candidatus Saccharimonadaceae bacterium]
MMENKMEDGINSDNSIPNEAGVPSVDESNVVESDSVWTSESPKREAPETTDDASGKDGAEATAAQTNEAGTEGAAITGDENITKPMYTPEEITKLAEAADYRPGEIEVNFVDELGNFDPQAFGDFMKQNNQNVFNQAINAANARGQLVQIENDTWGQIKTDYPEVANNETLTSALRGARIQDLLAGGDGDLARLAKDIVGPIRENRIKAVEDTNRQITEQKKLETFTPENVAPDRAEPSLMSQLQAAVSSGDTQKAHSLRHAIRKERIDANNS